jgi:membrane protein DedA with SNARE-associated domain
VRRFAPPIFAAAILWSAYAVLLGYLGGRTFRDKPLYAVLLAFGIAAVITLAVELARRARARSS